MLNHILVAELSLQQRCRNLLLVGRLNGGKAETFVPTHLQWHDDVDNNGNNHVDEIYIMLKCVLVCHEKWSLKSQLNGGKAEMFVPKHLQ